MKHPERIEDYLEHIAEAIVRAMGYLEHTPDLAAFEQDYRSQDAVVRNIEIIGEAVSRIQRLAPVFIKEHPEVPWAQIRAMRNVAIHEYFWLDLKIVWSTVKDDFPPLGRHIDQLLAQRRGREWKAEK